MTEVDRARCASRALFCCVQNSPSRDLDKDDLKRKTQAMDRLPSKRSRAPMSDIALACAPSVLAGMLMLWWATSSNDYKRIDELDALLFLPMGGALIGLSPFAAAHAIARVYAGKIRSGHRAPIARWRLAFHHFRQPQKSPGREAGALNSSGSG